MKKIKKLLIVPMLLIFCLATAITGVACNEKSTVKAKDIVNQSIEKMEELVYSETVQTQSQGAEPMLVYPTHSNQVAGELQSIMRGASFSLYSTQYLFNKLGDIELDTVYKDNIVEGTLNLTFLFKAQSTDGGIYANLEMHNISGQNTFTDQIAIYFNYDRENNTPTESVIVSPNPFEYGYSLSVAKFDYLTSTAYCYEITLSTTDLGAKQKLNDGTLDFTAFKDLTPTIYNFTKINLNENTCENYTYELGATPLEITEAQLQAFYNGLYDAVKDYCKEPTALDTTQVVSKAFYVKMYTYSSTKCSVLISGNAVVDTYLDYQEVKSVITAISEELAKTDYAGEEYNDIKQLITTAQTFLNSITAEEYYGSPSSDTNVALTPVEVTDSGISYRIQNYNDRDLSISFTFANNAVTDISINI